MLIKTVYIMILVCIMESSTTEKNEMAKHRHAELMIEFGKDALETDRPWALWEYKTPDEDKWFPLIDIPEWNDIHLYRRKPKTININGFEVPEPERMPLKKAQLYYGVNFSGAESHCSTSYWNNDIYDCNKLASGLIHLSKESAEIHTKALMSFTKKPDDK